MTEVRTSGGSLKNSDLIGVRHAHREPVTISHLVDAQGLGQVLNGSLVDVLWPR